MLENGIKILTELMPSFADKDAEQFLSQLTVYGVLSRSEDKLVNSKILDADKFTEIFSMLMPKQEDIVFPALQKICMKLKWRTMLHLIQSKLKSGNIEKFIVPDLELQKVHKIFKFAIPTTHMLFVGRVRYLTEIHDLIEKCKVVEQNDISNLVKIAVTGLGGVGKTQLVMRFLANYQLEYDSVIWINAESFSTTATSFTELGRQLKTYNKKMNIRSNVEAVYRKLGHLYVRNMVIFDNADEFIPSEFWFDQLDNFVLIITSRNREWPYFETKVDIGVFQPKDATEFVKKSLSEESYDSNGVDNLIKELRYFPLALQQAVAYIKQSHKDAVAVSSRFTINDYLQEFDTERRRNLLNFPTQAENNEVNYVTMLNTWIVTVEKLKRLLYHGMPATEASQDTLPIKILNLISFIDGEQIDPNYFITIAKSDNRHLGWSIRKLEQYSMVNKVSLEEHKEKNLISVHKLVQEITRIRLQDENSATKTFEACCRIMISRCPDDWYSVVERSMYKVLLPHFVSLKHVMDTSPYNSGDLKVHHGLLTNLMNWYSWFGNATLQKYCVLHILLTEQKLYGYGTQRVAETIYQIGLLLFDAGHLKLANILFKRSLVINSLCESDSLLKCEILMSLADSHELLGNLQMSNQLREEWFNTQGSCAGLDRTTPDFIQTLASVYQHHDDGISEKVLLENALEIQEKRFGATHPKVAIILTQLARTNSKLRNYKLALTLFERALNILENFYGPEDFRVTGNLIGISIVKGWLGDTKMQKLHLERALKIYENYCGPNDLKVVLTLQTLAIVCGELGDPQKKQNLLQKALIITENNCVSMHFMMASLLALLGDVYIELGDLSKAKEVLERAKSIIEKKFGQNNVKYVNILGKLAIIFGSGCYEMQKLLSEEVLRLLVTYYGSEDIEIIPTLENLYEAQKKLGNITLAKNYLERVLKIQEKFYGKGHFKIEKTRLLLEQVDEKEITSESLNNYLALLKQQYPANHPEILQCVKRVADLYASKGDISNNGMLLFECYLLN